MSQSYAFLRYLSTVSDWTATDKTPMFEMPLIFVFGGFGETIFLHKCCVSRLEIFPYLATTYKLQVQLHYSTSCIDCLCS